MSKTFDGCELFQDFGTSPNLYPDTKGHPGIDSGCGYGTDIKSPVSGIVSALYTPEKPASDGFVAIYILVQTKLETFEFCVGHCSKVSVKLGDKVVKGQVIGKEGNKGLVYYNNQLITLAMQKAGDKRGSHRHNQKRPVVEVSQRKTGESYLQNSKGWLKSAKGGYFKYALPYSEQASCVNFTLPLFNFDMKFGVTGYYVSLLQKALDLPIELQTGTSGAKTVEAVKSFQKSHNIDQTGNVGPKTRTALNSMFGQLEDPILSEPQPTPEHIYNETAIENYETAKANIKYVPLAEREEMLTAWDKIIAWLTSKL